MRELAGHTDREIADHLDTHEDAVRGLIARGRIGLRHYRAASELPCERAREAIAVDPHHRPRDRTVRRHVGGCARCEAYQRMLRDDAKALQGLTPISGGGLATGGAIAGGLGAKSALLGGALTQAGAACAASVCAVGSMWLIAPRLPVLSTRQSHSGAVHRAGTPAHVRVKQPAMLGAASSSASGRASTLPLGVTPAGVGTATGQRRLSAAGTSAGGSTTMSSMSTAAASVR
jgi:hypothetical protein